jgi:putative membrane protein
MNSFCAVLILLAQAGPIPLQAPMKENRAPVPASPAPMHQPESADVDRVFAVAFIQASNAEMDFANLAAQRATANEVKGYGAKMTAEHKGMSDELMPVLERLLSAPPSQMLSPADELAKKHLEAVKPPDFDQEYIMTQIGGHLAMLTAFQTEAENGTDAQLKELVRRWTPTIQAHLELAVDVAKHVGGSSPFKQ